MTYNLFSCATIEEMLLCHMLVKCVRVCVRLCVHAWVCIDILMSMLLLFTNYVRQVCSILTICIYICAMIVVCVCVCKDATISVCLLLV